MRYSRFLVVALAIGFLLTAALVSCSLSRPASSGADLPLTPPYLTPLPQPTQTPWIQTETVVETVEVEKIVEVEVIVTATPAPQDPPAVPASEAPAEETVPNLCTNHGVTAWQNDNQLSGALYGEAPVGGLDEDCWVVAQTWDGTERWVFAVRPHSVAWLAGHKGGTGWYFNGDEQSARDNLTEQAKQLEERDGAMKTTLVILPDEAENFRLVTRTQTKEQAGPVSVAPAVPTPAVPTPTPAPTLGSQLQDPIPTPEASAPATCSKVGESAWPVVGDQNCWIYAEVNYQDGFKTILPPGSYSPVWEKGSAWYVASRQQALDAASKNASISTTYDQSAGETPPGLTSQ